MCLKRAIGTSHHEAGATKVLYVESMGGADLVDGLGEVLIAKRMASVDVVRGHESQLVLAQSGIVFVGGRAFATEELLPVATV